MAPTSTPKKHPYAIWLGRKGGLASTAGRMKKMTAEQRRAIALHAITVRWERYRRQKAEQAARAGKGSYDEPKANALEGGHRGDR